MSVVKKTLKSLLKTFTDPVGQANDELEDKKFWSKDITKKAHVPEYKKYQKESEELDEVFADQGSGNTPLLSHRVSVTISDQHHTAASMRKVKIQKTIRVRAEDEKDAEKRAENHYINRGYKVHHVEHIEALDESEELDEKFINVTTSKKMIVGAEKSLADNPNMWPGAKASYKALIAQHKKHITQHSKGGSKSNEEVELDEGVSIDKDNYHWGKMITVHQGNSVSYPLHPEHQDKIKTLRDGESTSFRDETKSLINVKREGDKIHLKHPQSSKITTIGLHHFTESVELDESTKVNNELYKKAAKLAAEMTAYANSLKNGDLSAAAHLKAVDAQFAAYQAALEINHKNMMGHIKTADGHLDKAGVHDLDEDSQASGEVTKHVSAVHELIKAHHAALDKHNGTTTSRGAVLNATNQALKTAHGSDAPQISRLKDDENKPANVTAGKLHHTNPIHVLVRHLNKSTNTASKSTQPQVYTNEGMNMNLTPVQRKIRQVIEAFTSREEEFAELDEGRQLSTYSTKALQNHWDKYKDEQGLAPLFADHLKHVNKELQKRKKTSKNEEVELDEAFDGTHVVIDKPGHFLHGRRAAVFHRHDDGRVNAQVRTGRGIKDHEIHNVTLKPSEFSGDFKTLQNESVELDEAEKSSAYMLGRSHARKNLPQDSSCKQHPSISPFSDKQKSEYNAGYEQESGGRLLGDRKETKESTELDEWDAKTMLATAAAKQPAKSNRTIAKFKRPDGSSVTQVTHGDETDVKYDEDGNPIEPKTGEAKIKRGRGRPSGAKSGARTHGAEGGVKNQAIYGGSQFEMPTFRQK